MVQHFCYRRGCCGNHNKQIAVDSIVGCLCSILFDKLGRKVPAANRWYTFAPSLEVQTFGLLCHQVLARVIQAASLTVWEREAIAEHLDHIAEWSMSYSAYRDKKVETAIKFVFDDATHTH